MSSIKKRPNGCWRARYRDADGKEHARHFKFKDNPRDPENSAQAWLDRVTASVVTGSYVDPRAGRVTLETDYADWKERQVWAAGTAKAMDLATSRCTFKTTALGQLCRSHVEAWVKSMQTDGLAPSTMKTRMNNVRSVLRAAVRDRVIARDPSEGVTLPRQRRAEAAMTIPTPELVASIYGASEAWFKPFVDLCAHAGLRLGEAAAVQVGDIDFLKRELCVTRQVQRAGNGAVSITPPKYGSERTVPIPDELVLALSVHVKDIGTRGEQRWLFVGEGLNPPHQNTIGYHWRKTLTKAGLEDIRLHDLRHYYASGLIAAGCDVVTVQRALGHAKATTTLSTYSHLWPDASDRTRKAAGELLRTSRGLPADSDEAKAAPAQ